MDVNKLLLPILRKEQKNNGYISEKALKKISERTNIPVSRIYGVASFYSMLYTKKQDKSIIYVCDSLSCHVNNSTNIISYLKKKLKNNKKFRLHATACIGCCDKVPAMLLNGKAYTELTEEKIDEILKNNQ